MSVTTSIELNPASSLEEVLEAAKWGGDPAELQAMIRGGNFSTEEMEVIRSTLQFAFSREEEKVRAWQVIEWLDSWIIVRRLSQRIWQERMPQRVEAYADFMLQSSPKDPFRRKEDWIPKLNQWVQDKTIASFEIRAIYQDKEDPEDFFGRSYFDCEATPDLMYPFVFLLVYPVQGKEGELKNRMEGQRCVSIPRKSMDEEALDPAELSKNPDLKALYGKQNLDWISGLSALNQDVNLRGVGGATALHFACGYPEAVQKLLDAGANPDLPDQNGHSPLNLAVRANSLPSVRLLIEKGADPNTMGKMGPPLDDAVRIGNWDMVKYLIQKRAVPDNETGFALNQAAMTQNADTVKLLLDAGADPNVIWFSIIPNGPLDSAIQRGDSGMESLLRLSGAKLLEDLISEYE